MKKKLTSPILLFGSAIDCPDIEYISDFRAPDPVFFLQNGKKRYLLVSALELERAKRAVSRIEVLTPRMLRLIKGKRRKTGDTALQLLRLLGIRKVRVSSLFPHGIAKRLEKAGIRIEIIQGPVFPGRAVKSSDEIRKIKQSQQAAVIAMRSAVSLIAGSRIDNAGYLRKDGKRLTSEKIQRTILQVLIEHDCITRDTIVAGGVQAVNPHEAGHGPLKAGEAIVLDIFPQHTKHGYWGDLSRTVVRGKASPELKKMYSAVKAAQNAALSKVKAGVKCETVHKAAADILAKRGFKTGMIDGKAIGFFHSTGHGVGLSIHEQPPVGLGNVRLKSGNVITIEPGLYYPDKGGIRIEDTIVVTATGWCYLAPCEKRFEV